MLKESQSINNEIMRISTLRYEPNWIDPSQLKEYYGPPQGYTFWRVFIDDQLITTTAQPFTASDPTIELAGNRENVIWGDGYLYVFVRQISNFVIWSRPIEVDLKYFYLFHSKGMPNSQYFVFDRLDYIETLNKFDSAERANPDIPLPVLTASELRWLLQDELPSDDLPLYRTPENADDRRGIKLLRRIKEALQADDPSLTVVGAPLNWIVVEIGLDRAQSAECLWHIGKTPSGYAILFVTNPHFPLWLSSTALNVALTSEFG